MGDTPEDGGALPPSLRFLKGLVITLMITMILGVITVVWALVTRMPGGQAEFPALPAGIALPAGEVAQAVTYGQGFSIIVTKAGTVLIFDAAGQLRQSLTLGDIAPAN